MSNTIGGTQNITADGVLGTSGQPVRIYSVSLLSAASAGVVSLRAGTTVGGTIIVTLTGSAVSTTTVFNFEQIGLWFPTGCFVDIDANTTSVAISYVQE